MAAVQDESHWCEQVFQQFEFSVVRLDEGNGFIVHATDGGRTLLILTCQHVVGVVPVGGSVAAYFSRNTHPFNATVLHTDQGRDLALLGARGVVAPGPGPVTPLRFFDAEFVSGWNVVALSFIDMANGAAILMPGTFSGEIINEPDDGCLNCTCASKPGASGSPIILARVNKVVAVLAGCSLSSVDGIPVKAIKAFLCGWLGGGFNMAIEGLLILAAMRQ